MQTCFCDKTTAVKEDCSFCEFEKIILLHVTALHDLFWGGRNISGNRFKTAMGGCGRLALSDAGI